MSGLPALLGIADPTLVWIVVGTATAFVIGRPFGWPEAVWAVAGAVLLVGLGLLPVADALAGIGRGTDVYLFLTGMMLLSELARREGLFDWLAALAIAGARGSPTRLFALIYVAGTLVTIFMSNDATAVVLTPAVAVAARAAAVQRPLPYLFVCAFTANAASFVLPISNPANLVVFGAHDMPPLRDWLATFLLPSLLSIALTYAVLYLTQRSSLHGETIATDIARPRLSTAGKVAGAGILLTAFVLLAASALGRDLGPPTLAAALLTAATVLAAKREGPGPTLSGIAWSVLPLVAGLFVLVEALDRTGVIRLLSDRLRDAASASPRETAAAAGALVAFGSNLVNNLPAGLVAGSAVGGAEVSRLVAGAILIGVDLGPNLSVTGSLATILWLTALRREGLGVGAWQFLKLGFLVMPPALVAALAGLLLVA